MISGPLCLWRDEAVPTAQEKMAMGAAAKDEYVSWLSGKESMTSLARLCDIPMPREVSMSLLWMGALRECGLDLSYVLAIVSVVYLHMMLMKLTEI